MEKNCNDCNFNETCISEINQEANISLPISFKPVANIEKMKLKCIGEPILKYIPKKQCKDGCEIIVTQTISYSMPIKYGLEFMTGEIQYQCETPCLINSEIDFEK